MSLREELARAGIAMAVAMKLRGRKASSEQEFRHSIRNAVRGLWSGAIDAGAFEEEMTRMVERRLRQAWEEGLEVCGFAVSEAGARERAVLDQAIDENLPHVAGFAQAIQDGSQANGAALSPLLSRAEMWVTAWGRTKAAAQLIACQDQKLRWRYNPAKEHCGDCSMLHGKVYRASVWAKYNVLPRGRNLECGGWLCGCELEPTREPVTPGFPPRLSGSA